MNKIFIIGLPRTGTTSVSVALLDYGFKVAHTAYTKRAFELADVISDAPCFCDYPQLDKLFPNSRFVYLNRSLESWIPSARRLLTKMMPQLEPKSGYLHPVLKRAIVQTFALSTNEDLLSDQHLRDVYQRHQEEVFTYFESRHDLLSIDVSNNNSLIDLLEFLNLQNTTGVRFPKLNVGRQVDYWKEVKHSNKINSLSAGKEHRKFFDYQS